MGQPLQPSLAQPHASVYAPPWPVGCACVCGATRVACISGSVSGSVCISVPQARLFGALQRSQPPASLPEPVLMSLRPGAEPPSPQPLPSERALSVPTAPTSPHLLNQTGRLLAEDGRGPFSLPEETAPRWAAEHRLGEKKSWLTDGFDIFECPPPKTENEVRTRWAWLCRGWRAAGWGGRSEGEKNGQRCGPAWPLNPPCWLI